MRQQGSVFFGRRPDGEAREMIGLLRGRTRSARRRRSARIVFTREAIVDFARRFDPQPFHLDEAAAAKSIFGGLCASGWHTVSVSMRLLVDGRARAAQGAWRRRRETPPLGLGRGVRDLRWPTPVRPGDVIAFSLRVDRCARPGGRIGA